MIVEELQGAPDFRDPLGFIDNKKFISLNQPLEVV